MASASWHLLALGLVLAGSSIIMLTCAFAGDYWFIVDASSYATFCADYKPNVYYNQLETKSKDFKFENKKRRDITKSDYLFFKSKEDKKWYKSFFNKTTLNLQSFGGRDLFGREREVLGICGKLQFSTLTGLWKTCYQFKDESLMKVFINLGYISECEWIKYGNIGDNKLPSNTTQQEKSVIRNDENFFLAFRRLIISFLCLALLVQVFGSLLIIGGWFRSNMSTKVTGCVVLLISAIFLLAGLIIQWLMVKMQLTREPVDIYAFPPKVTYKYGHSNLVAWISFAFNILSSAVCVYDCRLISTNCMRRRRTLQTRITTKSRLRKLSTPKFGKIQISIVRNKSIGEKKRTSRLERRAIKENKKTNQRPSLRYQSSFEKNIIDSNEPIGWWRPLTKAS